MSRFLNQIKIDRLAFSQQIIEHNCIELDEENQLNKSIGIFYNKIKDTIRNKKAVVALDELMDRSIASYQMIVALQNIPRETCRICSTIQDSRVSP